MDEKLLEKVEELQQDIDELTYDAKNPASVESIAFRLSRYETDDDEMKKVLILAIAHLIDYEKILDGVEL